MVLNFDNVTYIDSNGIGQIIHIFKYVKDNYRKFSIINVDESVARVLEMAKLDKIIEFTRQGIEELTSEKSSEKNKSAVYIISEPLSEEKKYILQKELEKECIFLSFTEVDVEKLKKGSELSKEKSKISFKYKIMNSTSIEQAIENCGLCIENNYFDVVHEAIFSHPDAMIRREIILWVGNVKTDPLLLKIMKKAENSEKNENIKKAIKFTIEKLKKRNLNLT